MSRSDPSNVYECYARVPGAPEGSVQADCLHRWLNLQHCDKEEAPAEGISSEHRDAIRRTHVAHLCPIRFELQQDGRFEPTEFRMNGKVYKLVEVTSPEPEKP